MSNRYIVRVPNEMFSETVMGVQFNKGKAVVDEHTIDPSLGYTTDDIARHMETALGYEVEEIGAPSQSADLPKTSADLPKTKTKMK